MMGALLILGFVLLALAVAVVFVCRARHVRKDEDCVNDAVVSGDVLEVRDEAVVADATVADETLYL